jgi:hypothetical protein
MKAHRGVVVPLHVFSISALIIIYLISFAPTGAYGTREKRFHFGFLIM